eukprot:1195120-Prorocentrum_minimum.AAC.4
MATMNPGGDFGKKELSPALRNRFTEIWVPAIADLAELRMVVDRSLRAAPPAAPAAPLLVDFWAFFRALRNGFLANAVSVRAPASAQSLARTVRCEPTRPDGESTHPDRKCTRPGAVTRAPYAVARASSLIGPLRIGPRRCATCWRGRASSRTRRWRRGRGEPGRTPPPQALRSRASRCTPRTCTARTSRSSTASTSASASTSR